MIGLRTSGSQDKPPDGPPALGANTAMVVIHAELTIML